MTVGEKIKKFRTARELSQKQLAIMSGMSEPAIRNYELGNRQPSDKQLEKIADALGMSIFALSEPKLDNHYGVLHALFSLEDDYQLAVEKHDEFISLAFPPNSSTSDQLRKWQAKRCALLSGEISKDEYDEWRYSYPKSEAEQLQERLDKQREESKSDMKK